jgi:uncharacterized protein (DUF952 family)
MIALPAMQNCIFKICSASEWSAATSNGVYVGSGDDLRDGYIHLSTAEQTSETARKYFANCNDLLLIAFDVAEFDAQLRWEPSRGGAMFPHLYAALPTVHAVGIEPLTLHADGVPDVATALARLATTLAKPKT